MAEEAEPAPVGSDPIEEAMRAILRVPHLSDVYLSTVAESMRYAARCRRVPSDEAAPALLAAALERGMPQEIAVEAIRLGFWRADVHRGAIV